MAYHGAARSIASIALVPFGIAAALVLLAGVLVLRHGSWEFLFFLGFAWLATLLGIIIGGIAIIAAAFGRGRLPRWVSAVGLLLFVGLTAMAVVGLGYSDTKGVVALGLIGSLAGIVAAVRAWQLGGAA